MCRNNLECDVQNCSRTARFRAAETLEQAHIDGFNVCFGCASEDGAKARISSTTFHDYDALKDENGRRMQPTHTIATEVAFNTSTCADDESSSLGAALPDEIDISLFTFTPQQAEHQTYRSDGVSYDRYTRFLNLRYPNLNFRFQ